MQRQRLLLTVLLSLSAAAQAQAPVDDPPDDATPSADAAPNQENQENQAARPAGSMPEQDAPMKTALPPVVVSASRIEQDPKRLGVSFTVIDGARIEREQKVDLRRVLQDAPGVFDVVK